MLKIILFASALFLNSTVSFAQVKSLAEYNRVLNGNIADKKKLTAKEIKTLRIRLGTEITSADDVSYKEGELLHMLESITYAAFVFQDKELEGIAKDCWAKYLALANQFKKTFDVSYLAQMVKHGGNQIHAVEFSKFLLKFPSKPADKHFFFPVIEERCELLAYLRRSAEMDDCFKMQFDFAGDDLILKQNSKLQQLQYYATFYRFKDRFFKLAEEALAGNEYKNINQAIRKLYLYQRLLDSKSEEVEKLIEAERKRLTPGMDLHYLKLALLKNDLSKAGGLMKGITEHDVADPKIKIYFELAAEYYDRKNEFRRSNFYLDKKSELEEKTPLLSIGTYVEKLIVQTMIRANPNGPEVTKFLEESSNLISDLKIADDQLNAELKVLKLLSVETNKRDEVGIKNACIELQKFYAPNHYMSFLLNRLIEQIKDSLNKI